ncbi:hypothetical protein LSAT2_019542 [Lamellibrachia satsuma]|nr:hypothetical protein LSAT2_019542 [Lamellibrachia satsuma]
MEDGETLDLSEQHISPVELQAVTFVFKNSDFNSLSLKDCYLPGVAAETLASALHQLPHLTQLSVGGNTFSDAATSRALVESLSKMTSLWKLDLEDCELSGVATEALAIALHQLPGLTELRMGGNTFSDAATSRALVEGVLKMTSLWKLDLERCYLSGAAIEALANALHQLPLLTELGLSDCDIPANAMMALAGGLQHLTALEELSLENNMIDAAAAASLCRSLSQLRQLETFRFQGCHMDDTVSVDIANVAHKLHRLDDLGLVKNHITDDGVERVKEIWGRRRECVNLCSQEPPSERCGSRCDGGLYELFYRRPLSHDNSDSDDNDNLSSDDNSDSDDNDNLSLDDNGDSDGNDNLSSDHNGDSNGNDNLSSDDNSDSDGNDNLSSDDNSDSDGNDNLPSDHNGDSNGNDNLSSDDNSNHDDNWMSSDDNH